MSATSRRVVVTGGAGFIGSHLVDALVARGDRVTVIDDLSVGSRANLAQHEEAPGFEFHAVDVLDRLRVTALVADADLVFHLATQCIRLSLFDPMLVHRVNTEGTLSMLMAAREGGVGRFVYVSSSEAFGSAHFVPMAEDYPPDPMTIYGASKLAGEHYTTAFHRTHGLRTVVVRPFNTYGPRAHFEGVSGELIPKFVVRALNGRAPLIFGDGEQTRDFTYVEDTVRGLLLAADCQELTGHSVNIARGDEVSVNAIARLVIDACDRRDLEPEHTPDRPADVRRHFADISTARRVLGFEPRVDIADGIRRYVQWFRRAYPDPSVPLQFERAYNWRPDMAECTAHGYSSVTLAN